MTIEGHIENLKAIASYMPSDKCSDWIESLMAGVKALEQEPCEDCISRESIIEIVNHQRFGMSKIAFDIITEKVKELPSVTPQPKMGHCKDCKYFEYDSVAKVNGIPLIVAHEICKRWGDGCKSKEDGYCFLFEPRAESEEVE